MLESNKELLTNFYGKTFNKEFRAIPLKIDMDEYMNSRTIYRPVTDIATLIKLTDVHVNKKNNYPNVFISAYDFNPLNNIDKFHRDNKNYVMRYGKPTTRLVKKEDRTKYPYAKNIILDRLFIDFDRDYSDYQKEQVREKSSCKEMREQNKEFIEQGTARRPIEEARKLGKWFKNNYDLEPLYFFSGSKGCHLYVTFKPIKLHYPKEVLNKFIGTLVTDLKLTTLDTKVLEPARPSRIPTGRHPKTGYYVQPFKDNYDYFDIIDFSEDPETSFIPEVTFTNTKIHEILKLYDEIEIQKAKVEKAKNINPIKSNVKFIPKGMIAITKPEDVIQLLSFPCFNNMKWDDYHNLLLVNLLYYTDLETDEDVQKAMVYFWQPKGINMSLTAKGLARVKANKKGKYPPTNNTMKTLNLCPISDPSANLDNYKCCSNWKECFRYKLKLDESYNKKIKDYREKLNN